MCYICCAWKTLRQRRRMSANIGFTEDLLAGLDVFGGSPSLANTQRCSTNAAPNYPALIKLWHKSLQISSIHDPAQKDTSLLSVNGGSVLMPDSHSNCKWDSQCALSPSLLYDSLLCEVQIIKNNDNNQHRKWWSALHLEFQLTLISHCACLQISHLFSSLHHCCVAVGYPFLFWNVCFERNKSICLFAHTFDWSGSKSQLEHTPEWLLHLVQMSV